MCIRDRNWWCTLLCLSNTYLNLTTTCSWPLKNFSSKMNLSSHHVNGIFGRRRRRGTPFLYCCSKMYGWWYNSGHNNKVLKELNVTPTSDGYILFLFWKNVTVHQTINIPLLYHTKKLFLNRGCTISVTFHYFILGILQSIFPCITVLDAVKHLAG